jgi:hypothetical protein
MLRNVTPCSPSDFRNKPARIKWDQVTRNACFDPEHEGRLLLASVNYHLTRQLYVPEDRSSMVMTRNVRTVHQHLLMHNVLRYSQRELRLAITSVSVFQWPRKLFRLQICPHPVQTERLCQMQNNIRSSEENFPLIRHVPHRKRRLQQFFVDAGTSLTSCWLTTIGDTQREEEKIMR